MKKIIASAGLVALGIAGTRADGMAGAGSTDKPWSISASLRGFYDDNTTASPDGQDSFGVMVSPSVGVNLGTDQTSFGAKYNGNVRYYVDRAKDCIEHSHEFDVWLTHAFNERFSLDLNDSFIISQEPSQLDPTGGTVIRSNQDNLRNDGSIKFNAQLTRLFGIVMGYRNVLIDYDEPGYALILDRMEHYANLDFRWQVLPQTVAVLGYELSLVDHTHSDSVVFPAVGQHVYDQVGHKVYVGMDHNFSSVLMGSVKAGAQFTHYYNYTGMRQEDNISPYANLSLRYTYLPGSYLEAGFTHDRNQTDLAATDQETSSVFAALVHKITPRLTGTIHGRFGYHEYVDLTTSKDKADKITSVDLNLEYQINQHLSAVVAYYYDIVCSDVEGRSYDRNQVQLGLTASY